MAEELRGTPTFNIMDFLRENIYYIIVGAVGIVIGFLLGKVLDPPEDEELIESIARSEWARSWASKFCSGTGVERERCIELLARKVAETVAKGYAPT